MSTFNTQFTPGPWAADDRVEPWWGGDQPGCMVRFQVGVTGYPIANCLSRDTGVLPAVANARLIAAAPDLYKAATEAFEFLGGVDGAAEIRDRLLATLMRAVPQSERTGA